MEPAIILKKVGRIIADVLLYSFITVAVWA